MAAPLVGPVIGCMLVQLLTTYAGTLSWIDPNLLLGAVFMAAVLVVPKGLLPTAGNLLARLTGRMPV